MLLRRRRAGVEWTLTLVTQERDVHVLASPSVTWRASERPNSYQAAPDPPPHRHACCCPFSRRGCAPRQPPCPHLAMRCMPLWHIPVPGP